MPQKGYEILKRHTQI